METEVEVADDEEHGENEDDDHDRQNVRLARRGDEGGQMPARGRMCLFQS